MRGFGAAELLDCYARGVFPMAEGRDDPRIFLLDPDERGILPLDDFHIPRSLIKTVRRDPFEVVIDRAFEDVVTGCAEPGPGRDETWINDGIMSLYFDLFEKGFAHSVECWRDGELVGGLYGVALGGAFFGESMFSRATDASKVALVHLIARLRRSGFQLLDTQFTTDHLERFGALTIPRLVYKQRLHKALAAKADFGLMPPSFSGDYALQSITQTS